MYRLGILDITDTESHVAPVIWVPSNVSFGTVTSLYLGDPPPDANALKTILERLIAIESLDERERRHGLEL